MATFVTLTACGVVACAAFGKYRFGLLLVATMFVVLYRSHAA